MLNFRQFSRIYIPFILITIIVCIGIIGFIVIEDYRFLDAFYMTIITVATVGFQEVQPLSDEGRVFTAFLIITSFGTFAYAVTSISQYVIDGEFNQYYKNLNSLGLFYEELDYNKALPFLLMLQNAVSFNH